MPSDTAGSWTPVALSADLPPATVIPAWTPAGAIALWRSQSGRASASSDRCPHRGMRLSHGFVRGEALSCIYHGWSYSVAGGCVRIPAHPDLAPPETIRVAVQRVEESDGIVWVAVGEPALPPPRLGDLVPVRSLTLSAEIAAIETAAGGKANADGLIQLVESPWIRLLPAAQIGGTLVHVLVELERTVADRIMASRIAEALRRRVEKRQKDAA
ncbi:nitrite reductase/ring-hydroxylating ferredoxin subunit [Rhizobium binae]|uniref:Nitrite reductase/ring-hydroxylating ferredoxin subunit n=1 Tax=Rhizobium binae TaxID=1138190 RepID=A0ABV2MFP3_9HYPH|nr:Rieske 2Fe-2S domain-containing protein [Rhizobium binae]MBX4969011.1 Rieske 2Fe-2S domain-containing protein [Rhizobium binae]MBX4994757.1 Rieske 2Fe-2S domain-containing protein [Rhizobium binae]NKL49839.1 Rieske 2Fe-2S domain-containing protein [Rhizobium leguminosarum bv. viciae]QSY85293.1 Rieske 2Fe-2S domain-containing protein [Rhizobium binae]